MHTHNYTHTYVHAIGVVLVSLLLTLNIFRTLLECFYC